MATSASSLAVVRSELFATMDEAQVNLERFLEERDSGTLLQAAVANLQQIKGTLTLVGLPGAELLASEMHGLVMEIPAGANLQHNDELAAIGNGLHVLRSYLEQLGANWIEMPELLLPAINQLRLAKGQSRLPESYFFSARLTIERLAPPQSIASQQPQADMARLRHLYQQALLAVIREQQIPAALKLMKRIMAQLDGLDPQAATSSLYWIAEAMFESVLDGKLVINAERKLLFSRLDREIKQLQANPELVSGRGLIKDMLYLVALANSSGPLASELRKAANLASLPFTDRMLIDEYQRLSGAGANVMRSLSAAIREELALIKDSLDLIGRNSLSLEAFENLPLVVAKLEKTLHMVGLNGAAMTLQRKLQMMHEWLSPDSVPADELLQLADSVIYIEGLIASMEQGHHHSDQLDGLSDEEIYARHQKAEAGIVVRDECRNNLVQAKRAISNYVEAAGDTAQLADVLDNLDTVRGALWFVGEQRTARLVQQCADYIKTQMLQAASMPDEHSMQTLAEALTGIEYYLESSGPQQGEDSSLLDTVASNLQQLGLQVEHEL